MAECVLQKGGGGAGSDECTATKANVLAGTPAITKDSGDEPVEGTMVNQGAKTAALNCGGSYTIPAGYHNGSGKVTANTLASQTSANATAAQILSPQTAFVNGNKVTGTMPNQGAKTAALNCGGSYTIPAGFHNGSGKVTANSLASQTSATAVAGDIISSKTAFVNGVKITGTLAVQSILSFSAAPYSATQVTFTWKNPAKGAFSGVIIVGKTGAYPTSISDGTRWYKGSGNNTAANGTSSATVGGFALNTQYYFRAFSYALKSNAEWVHATSYTATAKTVRGQQNFTASGTFTVPAGVRSIDIFCVGGGAAGSPGKDNGSPYYGGAGGGSGYTATKKAYAVTPGQTFAVTVGAGGKSFNGSNSEKTGHGSATSFGSVLSANGGRTGYERRMSGSSYYTDSNTYGGNGGSGGGTGAVGTNGVRYGGAGGSDGANGGAAYNSNGTQNANGGIGQGTTTRAFGESSGTLYAGAGGGGTQNSSGYSSGNGGAGGGGKGGYATVKSEEDNTYNFYKPVDGTANTGGGGGGGHDTSVIAITHYQGGNGGSGICIVRWGY